MRNIRIILEFDGRNYAGWQSQPNRPTVQSAVAAALQKVLGKKLTVSGCGRTDAGVSARNYVANFHTDSAIPLERLRMALNCELPQDILVKSAEEVSPDFHARYRAKSKTYVYRIIRGRSPLRQHHAWEFRYPLNPVRMRQVAKLFIGHHDFQPFCQTKAKNGYCRITSIRVKVSGDELLVTVRGNRFLYKMVRRIVGALVAYGTGRLTQEDIKAALAGKLSKSFPTAPAQGLVLDSVDYNENPINQKSETRG